ncbi:hypothetical protein M4Z12_20825 [Pseudomonas sp. In614]|uniref:Uncharacterized protein n=1 Tax=Pseudomonas nunensis TaxID=2961896 RepID=A0ABY5ES32_9PSED|nr:hypothetical protein [Pseudomonas nunensis]MCL5228542.1 hypothetical protein [Pseudomonas nunensis]UTO16990.1 hypothetical protein NK667_11780 [Pseudomonas nunensis]
MGKLSAGGSPKAKHILYKLSDGANGTGIDAVWRVNPANNDGEQFAIVEAKASRDEDAPKFMRKKNNTRQPGISSRLGVAGLTDSSELIEPIESDENNTSNEKKNKISTEKNKPTTTKSETPPYKQKRKLSVQMNREWIDENLGKAVNSVLLATQITHPYSRHLFYTPLYHTSLSPQEHASARLNNTDEISHKNHKAFHYADHEVKNFVNKRKKSLAKKHGMSASLKLEV